MAISITGTGTITGISAGGLPDDCITTAEIAGSAVTTAKILDANITSAKLAQPLTSGTAVASTSGTAIDFTGIPSWAKEVTISFSGVSTTGASVYLFQLGTSGGVENSGYNASGSNYAANTISTAGFPSHNNASTFTHGGFIKFVNVTGNTWAGSGNFGATESGGQVVSIGGNKTLSGVLDRVRITTAGGTDTFDAGSINIMYEG
jgi:hypothetical protein